MNGYAASLLSQVPQVLDVEPSLRERALVCCVLGLVCCAQMVLVMDDVNIYPTWGLNPGALRADGAGDDEVDGTSAGERPDIYPTWGLNPGTLRADGAGDGRGGRHVGRRSRQRG